jgi:hypothetical protein
MDGKCPLIAVRQNISRNFRQDGDGCLLDAGPVSAIMAFAILYQAFAIINVKII